MRQQHDLGFFSKLRSANFPREWLTTRPGESLCRPDLSVRAELGNLTDRGYRRVTLTYPGPKNSGLVPTLTERELVVLRLLATRLSTREIGQQLHVSVNTVRTQVRAIHRKLEVSSRAEAVAHARQLGLLPGSPGHGRDHFHLDEGPGWRMPFHPPTHNYRGR